jgi:hypothetical protein
VDPTGTDHDFLGRGLRKALYNYMHGVGLELDVRSWFAEAAAPARRTARRATRASARRPPHRPRRVPAAKVAPDLIANALRGL